MDKKLYPVFKDTILKVKDIRKLLKRGYTHYLFPKNPSYPFNEFPILATRFSKNVIGMMLFKSPDTGMWEWIAVTNDKWEASRRPFEVYKEKLEDEDDE